MKRALLAIAAAGIAGALLFNNGEKDAGGRVVISYGMFGTPEQLVLERKLLDVFEKENPGIHITIRTPSSGGYMEKLLTELAGRVAPDVTFMGTEHFQMFADKQVFLPLNRYLQDSSTSGPEAYFPEILRAFTREGQIQALPKNAASDVIFYNKDHFDAEGIPYPDETWDWDDLLSASLRLTKDLNGDGRRDRFALANFSFLDYLRQHGVEIISADGKQCLLNTPRARECCQFVYDLMYKHKVMPTESRMAAFGISRGGAGSFGMFDLFSDQHASMLIMDVVLALKYESAPFDWDTAMQPAGPTPHTYIHGAGYAINSRSQHPDEAWKLVQFLAGPYVQRTRAVAGDSLPSLKEIAFSETWRRTRKKPRNRDAVTSQMLTATPPPPHTRWARVVSEVWLMYNEFTAEENPLTIDDALRKYEHRINRVLRNED